MRVTIRVDIPDTTKYATPTHALRYILLDLCEMIGAQEHDDVRSVELETDHFTASVHRGSPPIGPVPDPPY